MVAYGVGKDALHNREITLVVLGDVQVAITRITRQNQPSETQAHWFLRSWWQNDCAVQVTCACSVTLRLR